MNRPIEFGTVALPEPVPVLLNTHKCGSVIVTIPAFAARTPRPTRTNQFVHRFPHHPSIVHWMERLFYLAPGPLCNHSPSLPRTTPAFRRDARPQASDELLSIESIYFCVMPSQFPSRDPCRLRLGPGKGSLGDTIHQMATILCDTKHSSRENASQGL